MSVESRVTHILEILDVSGLPPGGAPDAGAVRKRLTQRLRNCPVTWDIAHGNRVVSTVTIAWTECDSGDPPRYHARDVPYTDSIVAAHVERTLKSLASAVSTEYPSAGRAWTLTYSLSRPLRHEQTVSPAQELAKRPSRQRSDRGKEAAESTWGGAAMGPSRQLPARSEELPESTPSGADTYSVLGWIRRYFA